MSLRIAISVLMEVPAYELSTQTQIKYLLERSFIPKLTNYKTFVVTDMMQDVVLIEGTAKEATTNEVYSGPCYIPR